MWKINHDTDKYNKKFSEKGIKTALPGSEDENCHFYAATPYGSY
jgi:hypothetical protein